ncbi:MAG: CAP domain-containing protein [Angelakisella sp.]
MKQLKKIAVAAAIFTCLCLSGCKELPIVQPTLTPEQSTVIVGETILLPIPPPAEKATGAVFASGSGSIEVDYTAPNLIIKGIAPGKQSVIVEFSAGWLYKKNSITIPITVELPKLEASLDKKLLTIAKGESFSMTVTSPEAGISVLIDDKAALPNLEVTQDGTTITLNAKEVGTSKLPIIVSKEGFRDAVLTCEVEVIPIPVPLTLDDSQNVVDAQAGTVTLSQGKTAIVTFITEGELSAASDNPTVTTVVENGKLKLTGISEGTATISVTAKKEGFLDNTLTLSCTVKTTAPPPPPAYNYAYPKIVNDIVKYTNVERANEGLAPLKLSSSLSKAADLRAKETATPGYQEHTRPNGRRGITAITDAGLGEYDAQGENLAGANFAESGEEVVKRWMDSPSHRAAILMPQFKSIGIGVYYDGDMYRYVQLFTGTKL